MENLFFEKDNQDNIRCFDLKGSRANRYISKKQTREIEGQVLQDTNFKEEFKGEPIPLGRSVHELFRAAIHNDSLILSKMNVIDYSLLLIIDYSWGQKNENKFEEFKIDKNFVRQVKSIRVGVIDYARKYTWDKQVEHMGKSLMVGQGGPTIVNPQYYKDRFKEAIDSYFIGL